jgi:hypothetical protein
VQPGARTTGVEGILGDGHRRRGHGRPRLRRHLLQFFPR